MSTSAAGTVDRRTARDVTVLRRARAMGRRAFDAVLPLPPPDRRFEARRRADLRAFLGLFLVFQIGYAVIGAMTAGPSALASDRNTAIASGLGFAAFAAVLLVVVLRSRSLTALEIAGSVAGLACLCESLFGQVHNPETAAAVTAYEAIGVAVVAFAVPWRPRYHYAWVAAAVAFGQVGLMVVPSAGERGALGGALVFAILVACTGKPLVWNSRVERHLQTMHVRRLNLELQVSSRRDPTTGCETRRALDEYILHLAHRRSGRVAFAMVDADHFKSINDLLGHRAGDTALRRISDQLRISIRDTDRSFRYGGEEFLVVFDPVPRGGSGGAGERIREAVEAAAIPNPSVPSGIVTVSIGVAELPLPASVDAILAALNEADARMYLAKQLGRNRVRGEDLAR